MTENSTGAGTETPASAFHALLELSAARDPAGSHSLHHDLETRSKVELKETGAAKYASDPSTEVLCLCYAVDDEPVQLWTPGDPIPSEFIEAARNPLWTIGAHNDAFERLISRHILEARHGFPAIPIERRRCSMATAYAAALPGSLEKVVEVLGLPYPKDKAGQALMRRMSKPLPGGGWLEDVVSRERLHTYCKRDVEAERAVYNALPQLTAEEQRLWALDAVINDRGFAIDGELLEAADRIVTASEANLQAEFREITGLDSTHQTQKFIDWLAIHDCEVEDVQKGTLHHALRRKGLEDGVRRAIELRLQLAHASAAKIKALLAWRIDNRVRGSLIFHGASTGRWTARGPQPQNFKRDSEGMDVKVAAVLNGGAGLASPVEAVGDIARAMIVAAPGHRLMIGDFSGVESRVIAWISEQLSKLEQWAKFDRTGALADDPYYILGHACGLAENIARPNGKICDLAFGYQGGLGAWKNQAPENDPSTDDDIRRYQQKWKAQHPFTVAFWKGIDSRTITAVRVPGKVIEYKRMRIVREGDFLRITLPSGRALSYPFPQIIKEPKYEQSRVIFKDASGGKWTDCNFGKGAYGGLWTENIVSAIARDLLAGAMLQLDAAGYRVVLTVHDEVVVEVPDGFGSLDEFKRLLIAAPDWVDGILPIAAKVRESRRFSKPDAPNGKAAPQAAPERSAPAERPQPEMPASGPEPPPAPRSPEPTADPETIEDLLASLPGGGSNGAATGEEAPPWSVEPPENPEEPPGPEPPGPPMKPPGPPGGPGLAASFEVGAGGNELATTVLRVRAEIEGLYAVAPRHGGDGGNDAGHSDADHGGTAAAEKGGGDNGFDAAADGHQQEDVGPKPGNGGAGAAESENGRGNGRDHDDGGYPHGERRTGGGRHAATYLYRDHLARNHTRIKKLAATSTRRAQYPQEFWVDDHWVSAKPAGWLRIPYRLPELLAGIADGRVVFIPEGEKDCETLVELGLFATTNSEGATPVKAKESKWTPELNKWFHGLERAFILEDNDEPGRKFAREKLKALRGIIPDIRIVSFPDVPQGEDVSYWIKELGHSKKELIERCKAAPPPGGEAKLESVLASEVEIRAIEWLWDKRFAVGKIGVIAGLPDEGKGQVMYYIAARITRGQTWPIAEGRSRLGNVIILSAEEDFSDSLIPRLMAAGADLDRVRLVQMVREPGEDGQSQKRMFSLVTDLEMLRQKIDEMGDVAAVFIDPISSYLGLNEVDSYRDTDVRAVLGPLKELAEEMRIAIITIMHFNKKADVTNAMLRISNSLAFVGLPRHVYAVVADAENERKLLVRAKNNDAPVSDNQTLAFRFKIVRSRIRYQTQQGNPTALHRMGNGIRRHHRQRGDAGCEREQVAG